MKKSSIKFRINLWYTVLMTFLAILTAAISVSAGKSALYDQVRQNLIKDVERNIDSVETHDGRLDIDSDFNYRSSDTFCLVFSSEGKKLDGVYPEEIQDTDTPLENEKITKIKSDKKTFFIYDSEIIFNKLEVKIDGRSGRVIETEGETAAVCVEYDGSTDEIGKDCKITVGQAFEAAIQKLKLKKLSPQLTAVQWYDYFGAPVYELEIYTSGSLYDSVWIRGIALTEGVTNVWTTVSKLLLCLLPVFILFAAFSGAVISRREMGSIDELSRAISEISTANDLTKNVEIQSGDRELQSLADNFNSMFRRLKASFESEKQFTSDASHELRTPIAVILSECELQKEKGTDEETERCLNSIMYQAQYMKKLIAALLYSARIGQGKEHFVFERHCLSELVAQCAEDCETVYGDRVHVETDVKPELYLDMDVSLLASLVNNLLTNAVKYGKENGTINVSLDESDGVISLSVKNEGIGIKPEDREKIFSRFYRVDKAHSRSEGSYGLGLAISKQIAVLHGGDIAVESEYGKSCTFTVKFFEKN